MTANALEKIVTRTIDTALPSISDYVDGLRQKNPELTSYELARKIVRRKAMKSGLVGAVTGAGGAISMPVSIPAEVIATWHIQVSMILAVAHTFDQTGDTADLRTDIFLIIAGNSVKEALKQVSIEAGKEITEKAIRQYITREMAEKAGRAVSRKVIARAGEKSLASSMKLVPLIGAPIGFAFDWTAAIISGKVAINYYSGRG
ncbi:hypothetical protein DENIS_1076 [Desulfonema ishimotonii]|uniref:EcsC family protein n=1 Tax=Desulfonema ishimotonii TaxID=45657 RepID=A0A401FT39_9BACT|nr:EcsC family protein [Desulfonema ishimotonii]GBC60131.1 hypothetical protein DENIS_1076 [Desulfonema ishimotonii]